MYTKQTSYQCGTKTLQVIISLCECEPYEIRTQARTIAVVDTPYISERRERH